MASVRYKLFHLFTVTFIAALASGTSAAQILPPIVGQPVEILQPPLGYPATTAPSAVGSYLAAPAWGQTIPGSPRFVILTNFGSDAVLDRETGLVWGRQPAPGNIVITAALLPWAAAEQGCLDLVIGGRGGWRLPRMAELKTLVDFSIPESPTTVRLPAGHPFFLHPVTIATRYWTSDRVISLGEHFHWTTNLRSGASGISDVREEVNAALCVRGRE